jgi:ubiquinone/menaquinone biosynthesis C-methylase UbiE
VVQAVYELALYPSGQEERWKSMTEHHRLVEQQFARQAPGFGQEGLTLTNRDYLTWMVDALDPDPHDAVLDVAAGTGHLGRAIAPRVRCVVCLDLTPDMLHEGERAARREGLTNITFLRGAAENLPYPQSAFDAVVSRFAVHHFVEPLVQVREMVRVCRPGGKVVLIDLVAPEEKGEAAAYNRLERLRDPSHTLALSIEELRGALEGCGLSGIRTASRDIEVEVERWLALTSTATAKAQAIRENLMRDVLGSLSTGMRPFLADGVLMFTQRWVVAVGLKAD